MPLAIASQDDNRSSELVQLGEDIFTLFATESISSAEFFW
jgi:hypothetical protein